MKKELAESETKVARAKEAMMVKPRSRSIGRQTPSASRPINRPRTAPSNEKQQQDTSTPGPDLVAEGTAQEAAVRAKLLMSFQQRDLKDLREKVRKGTTVSGYPRKTSSTTINDTRQFNNHTTFGGRSTLLDQTKSFEAKVRGERSKPVIIRPMLIENVEKLAVPSWRMQ